MQPCQQGAWWLLEGRVGLWRPSLDKGTFVPCPNDSLHQPPILLGHMSGPALGDQAWERGINGAAVASTVLFPALILPFPCLPPYSPYSIPIHLFVPWSTSLSPCADLLAPVVPLASGRWIWPLTSHDLTKSCYMVSCVLNGGLFLKMWMKHLLLIPSLKAMYVRKPKQAWTCVWVCTVALYWAESWDRSVGNMMCGPRM